MTVSAPSRITLIDEDELPAGITSTQQEEEYVTLLAEAFFDPADYHAAPFDCAWTMAANARYDGTSLPA